MARPPLSRCLGAFVALAPLAAASQSQEVPSRGRYLTLAAGPLLASQRDASASPLRYTGIGAYLEAGYTARTDRGWLTLRVSGATGALHSHLTGSDGRPRQRTWRGRVEVAYARALDAAERRTQWYVGAFMTARTTTAVHTYGDPIGSEGGYWCFAGSLGPLLAAERAIGARHTVSARLGVAMVAVVGRPYGSLHRSPIPPIPPNLHWEVASITAFRGAHLTTAYAVPLGERGGITIRHDLVVEHYRGPEAFRFASQGLSLSLALRVGGHE